jgi:DNA anti-recombination protein RmuC
MALDELRKMQQTATQEFTNVGQSFSEARQDLGQQIKDIEGTVGQPVHEMHTSNASSQELPRHEIIEEHHAVLPESVEPNKIHKT